MTDFRAEIVTGEPAVPQDGPNTQYAELRLGRARRPCSRRPARARSARACCCAPAESTGATGEPAPRTARARPLATGSGRGGLARGRLRAPGRGRPDGRRRRRGSPRARLAGPRRHGHAAGRLGRRRATTCGSSSSRSAGRCGCSTTPPTASPRSAWCARRTAAGSRAAAPAGCRAGRAAGRSARAAPSTSARAPRRRSRASFRRSGGCGPTTCRSRRSWRLPNGLNMLVGARHRAERLRARARRRARRVGLVAAPTPPTGRPRRTTASS